MSKFRYVAKDKSGRTIKGQISADSREDLISELGRKKLTIISLEETEKFREDKIFKILTGGRVKMFDLILFCRQLSVMLRGGIPILRATESISEEAENRYFRKVLKDVSADLQDGKSLSESLKKYPHTFSTLFIAIVETGEKVGSLEKMLLRLSGYLEARERLIKKMRLATTYPLFITLFFLFTLTVLTLFVMPKFQSIYSSLGVELPKLTLFILTIVGFVIRNIHFFVIILIAVGFSLAFYIKRTKKGRFLFDSALFKLPLIGSVIKKAAVSKFCRTLSTLLDQGVPITEAMLLVGKTSGNMLIENAGNKASRLLVEGETIPQAFDKTGIFPPLMMQMVSVGVESGSLPELLDKTADFYEERVDIFINVSTALIEPILVVLLGVIIGVVVVALYLPIFKLGSALADAAG